MARLSTLTDSDLTFYAVYVSKYNRETLHALQYDFTFLEFNTHKQFIEAQEDLEEEANRRALEERK